jgi:hypothetical protein
MTTTPQTHFNVHSEKDIRASLEHWSDVLADRRHEHQELGRQINRVRAMLARRQRQLRELEAHGDAGAAAVRIALRDAAAGVHELGSSNRGERVDAMQRRFHVNLQPGRPGVPWCGAAVGTWLEEAGFDLTDRILSTELSLDDANEHRNGLKAISLAQVRAGDLIFMDFSPAPPNVMHVGMARGPIHNGEVPTVEGNTSPTHGGSQDNGGCVAAKSRPRSVIVGAARATQRKAAR